MSSSNVAAPSTIAAPFERTFGTTTAQFIGSAIPARSIAANADGGFFSAPFRLPPTTRYNRPISVITTLAPLTNSTVDGQVVVLSLDCTIARTTPQIIEINVTQLWTVPNAWLTTEPIVLTIDAGSGFTFPKNTFRQTDTIALRIIRLGSAAQDTFAQGLKIASALLAEFENRFYSPLP